MSETPPRSRLAELRTTPIGLDEVTEAVRHSGAGAVATFLGIVRDTHEGRAVTALEYQAYAEMANRQLLGVIGEIEAEVPGVRLAVLHRTGELVVGDVAVACAASAPHRAEAFAACRTLIDRVKERVPIWKRERGSEGSLWLGWDTPGGAGGG